MKKIIRTVSLAVGILATTGILASAAQGPTVSGTSGDTSYYGYIQGEKTDYGCYAATSAFRSAGSKNIRAYVEIVNSQGYIIGAGQANTGTTSAYSGTISRAQGQNAYGNVGTADASSRTNTRLY